MRVAVVFFAGAGNKSPAGHASALMEGLSEQGHEVDLIDGDRDINVKLTMHEYIVIGANAANMWGGKLSEQVGKFLSDAGIVSGKRCYAFVNKGGLKKNKTLRQLMNIMEREGMYLKKSDLISSPEEAREIGRKLHVK
ncbi:MAG TPA: hypothetical protein ENN41_06155 [Sediminispirochaeta sp.]|nr:hypothetical protein [Sediminispirochaeta sp.]